eukprot:TRINITY_DN45073_c0_g1_i1.p1 TRINITY_DN45073_c0_g1~~TRINITY_DN45073_c0_g1_i1.p1  ORF type:complete len:736 (+),score=158.91 TRINITY_DN45073_c0_g1_i1:108-2315(+)
MSLAAQKAALVAACGPEASLGSGALRVDSEGLPALRLPWLCTSYRCREAALVAPGLLDEAVDEALMACALPKLPGKYLMLDAVVSGLGESSNAEWWTWISSALGELGVADASIVRRTWFPAAAGVRFLVSVRESIHLTTVTAGALLAKLQGELLSNATAASLLGTAAFQALEVASLEVEPLEVAADAGDVALFEMWWLQVFAGVLLLYGVLATAAHVSGLPWMHKAFLCWPELCDGGGCICYRVLCMPCVLTYNAIRIFWCDCCCGYLSRWGMLAACKGCCWREFADADFPPDDRSIGQVKGDTASGMTSSTGVEWVKASTIAAQEAVAKGQEATAHLFQGEIEPADVLQGALGDCWLMAALACVAERPEVLQQAIVSKHVDPRGKYYFRLFNQVKSSPGTKWVDIVIDDKIPVEPGTLKPKFARTHCNEMWVLLLEKAFAKMYGGYDRLDGGQMSWALTALTGNPSIDFSKEKLGGDWMCSSSPRQGLSDDEFFKLLQHTWRNGAFLCCAEIAQTDTMGLIDGHAYSIIQLVTARESAFSASFFRFVQIRNPHGQTEWTGAWSDHSAAWDKFPHVRSQLLGEEQDARSEDGTFWMQWEDFVQFWKLVQVVDCDSSIRMLATPVHQDLTGACLHGCFHYWCCCVGFLHLYCGRQAATDLETLQQGSDGRCGWDQSGCYCRLCEEAGAAYDVQSAGKGGAAAGEEHMPLCCSGRGRRTVSRNSMTLSRSRDPGPDV